jgi:DNA-nicking Smr family endonuclease
MNFGDILNQWDKQQKDEICHQKESGKSQVSHKKANAPTPEEKEAAREKSAEIQIETENGKTINPMCLWMNRYGVIDKDKMADETAERAKFESRSYLAETRIEARIDLHGLTAEEARSRLDSFVGDCQHRGIRKILIIHGKGIHTTGSDPVLGSVVRDVIEEDSRLGMSGHPDKRQGGNGATWVIIRTL